MTDQTNPERDLGLDPAGAATNDSEGGRAGDEEMGTEDEPDMSDGAFPAEAGER